MKDPACGEKGAQRPCAEDNGDDEEEAAFAQGAFDEFIDAREIADDGEEGEDEGGAGQGISRVGDMVAEATTPSCMCSSALIEHRVVRVGRTRGQSRVEMIMIIPLGASRENRALRR